MEIWRWGHKERKNKCQQKKVEGVIHANGIDISVVTTVGSEEDYISLTDIAKYQDPENPRYIIQNWMRSRSTIEFLGIWEELNNPNFNRVEFDAVKHESGTNAFVMTPSKWIRLTNSIGLTSKSGRHGGGTFAHKDIAFEFASWLSPGFKLYIIQDYQRLKVDEGRRLALDWNVKRILARANYRIHTDAIKANLIPPKLPKQKQGYVYADEADILNIALFGKTAKQWKRENPDAAGNMRDYASIEQLLVLSNLENINAMLIEQGIEQYERLERLRMMAIQQLEALTGSKGIRDLNQLHNQLKLPTDE